MAKEKKGRKIGRNKKWCSAYAAAGAEARHKQLRMTSHARRMARKRRKDERRAKQRLEHYVRTTKTYGRKLRRLIHGGRVATGPAA